MTTATMALSVHEVARHLDVTVEYIHEMIVSGDVPIAFPLSDRPIAITDLPKYEAERQMRLENALRKIVEISEESGLYEAERLSAPSQP